MPRPAAPRAQPATAPAAPAPTVSEIPPAHRQLANVVASLSDDEAARRIVGYFRVIDALELGPSASTLSRREKLKALLERVQSFAKEADNSRPVEASIVVPVYNKIEYTIACVISLLEHKTQLRFEILIGNDRSTDETRETFKRSAEMSSASRRPRTEVSSATATSRPIGRGQVCGDAQQ